MRIIKEINNNPNQTHTLVGDNGEQIEFTMIYKETQGLWFMSVSYESFKVENVTITKAPNMLRQWQNIIPFGIGCGTTDKGDPYFLDDFSNGRASIYILSKEDVLAVESDFYGF